MHDTNYVSPEWSHAALLLIDAQYDFVSGSSIVDGTAACLGAMAELASAFRCSGRHIVHVVRLYPPGSSDIDTVRRSLIESRSAIIAAPGTPGSQIPTELLAQPVELDYGALLAGTLQRIGTNEFILYKPRWSAFYRTSLDAHLRAREISTVVVAGCNLPNCPRATLFDASQRDYRTVLATDATSQATPQRIEDLSLIGVGTLDTASIVTAVSQLHSPIIRIAAAVVVDDVGRALLVRKRGTTAFMQPGGKIDPGETAAEALQRELSEELNVTVASSDMRALGQYTASAANEPGHLVSAELFSVTLQHPPRPGAEIEEIAWIDPVEHHGVELAPLTEFAVLTLLRESAGSDQSTSSTSS